MPEAMLFPFIDDAMKLIAFALLIAVPMMMTRRSRPQAMARLQRRRERKPHYPAASTVEA
jgi:hypothetical protein